MLYLFLCVLQRIAWNPFLLYNKHVGTFLYVYYFMQIRLLIPLFTQSECQSSERLSWFYLNVDKGKMLIFLFMPVNIRDI